MTHILNHSYFKSNNLIIKQAQNIKQDKWEEEEKHNNMCSSSSVQIDLHAEEREIYPIYDQRVSFKVTQRLEEISFQQVLKEQTLISTIFLNLFLCNYYPLVSIQKGTKPWPLIF